MSGASEKVLQQVQAIVQASLYLGANDPEDSTVLGIYVMDKDVALVLYQDPTTESKSRNSTSGQNGVTRATVILLASNQLKHHTE